MVIQESNKMQSKKTHIRTLLLQLIVALILFSCSNNRSKDNLKQNWDKGNIENCILEKKISKKKTAELEKNLGSQELTNSNEEICYKRINAYDTIPYTVTYTFSNDSVILVEYQWENLPGKKRELENYLTKLFAVINKRSGKPPRVVLDANRDYMDRSTRIDFDDAYFWRKTKLTTYAVSLYYHDSGRQGESSLTLEIDFSY